MFGVWGGRISLFLAFGVALQFGPRAAAQDDARDRAFALQGMVSTLEGGNPASARVRTSEDGFVRFVGAPGRAQFRGRGGRGVSAGVAAASFVRDWRGLLANESPRLAYDVFGSQKAGAASTIRFDQTYDGLPVFGAQVVLRVNAAGGIESLLSDVARNTAAFDLGKLSTSPSLSASAAEFEAFAWMTSEYGDFAYESSEVELMVYEPSVVGETGVMRLVWYMVLAAQDAIGIRETILVDAHDGAIALHYSLIHEAKNRLIYHANNTSANPGTLVRSEGGAVSAIADANFAYEYFGDTYDFYFEEHGRDSLNNSGYTLSGTVRYCEPGYPCPFPNAFWDGARMYFGQGWAAADDVVAHELTHGVTTNESNLIYVNQSGAINESFSDMWGEWVDLVNGAGTDTAEVRWLIGEDIPGVGAIRDMMDPTAFGDPDRMGSPLFYSGPVDNGGVHINSGVGNKLCYLLTDGGTFNGQTIASFGISMTAALFYECQVNLLTPGSNYEDLYDAITQAAIILGLSQPERDNLEAACVAVQIKPGTVPIPENDECGNAICVSAGVPYVGTTIGATGTDITSCTSGDSIDVWHRYTPATSGSVTISTCGAGTTYDSAISVFTACGGTQLACNDDFCELSSMVTLNMTAGVEYLIRLAGFGGSTGGYELLVSGGDGTCVTDSVTVLAPNGSEDWLQGSTQPIAWSTTGLVSNVDIELLRSGMAVAIIASNTPNDGVHDFIVPVDQAVGSDYSVRIVETGGTASDSSDALFSVSAPVPNSIRVKRPNGGEVFYMGTGQPIRWTSTGDIGANVSIHYYRKGGAPKVIINSTPNDGSYMWGIPANITSNPNFFVRIASVSDPGIADDSDARFTITNQPTTNTPPNTPSIISPVHGATNVSVTPLMLGSTFSDPDAGNTLANEEWQVDDAADFATPVYAAFDSDGGMDHPVPAGVLNANTMYYARVRYQDNTGLWSAWSSMNAFTTGGGGADSITVLSPNGGEVVHCFDSTGVPVQITWSSSGNVGTNVRIRLHRGSSMFSVVASTPNDGVYDWQPPSNLRIDDYTIRVSSNLNPTIADTSDSAFLLTCP